MIQNLHSSTSPLRHVACLLVALTSLGAMSAHAQPVDLGPAFSRVGLVCDPPMEVYEVEAPVDDLCVINNGFTDSSSKVVTRFGPVISASALTESDGRFIRLNFNSFGRVEFELRVREIATPGQPVTSIPVRFSVAATVDTSAVGIAAQARVAAHSPSGNPTFPDLLDVRATTIEGSTFDFRQFDTMDVDVTVNLVIDDINIVNVEASCKIDTDFDDDIEAKCNVSEVSGSFAFDQQAFDLAQGKDTFPLDDFYMMDVSPGIVPEPSRAASSLAVLVALSALRRAGRATPIA